jgi:hypothetical protein
MPGVTMRPFAPLLAFFLFASGCSLKTMALHSTAALLEGGAGAIYEEPDVQLAQEAMASQIKLLETLLRNEPANRSLLLLASEALSGYAFLFIEEPQPERARGLYRRSRDYALRALTLNQALARLSERDMVGLEKILQAAGKNDVGPLFWAALGWASFINLSKDSPEALLELPKAVALMKRVHELSPGFHFAGPELFFAGFYASRPPLLGGDLNKAKSHFELARQRTGGHYLMAYVLEARLLAVAIQDKELFKSLLEKTRELPSGALPGAHLTDEIAKLRAAALLDKTDELF